MNIKTIIFLTFILGILLSSNANSEDQINISYNEQLNTLKINVIDAPLDKVLQVLSSKLNFKLTLDGDESSRKVTLTMTGSSKKVIEQLVKPHSVIISQAETKPYKVTNVFLLPVGEQSRIDRLHEKMPPPRPTGDVERDLERQKHYERRIQRKLEGHGRRQDELFNDASGANNSEN